MAIPALASAVISALWSAGKQILCIDVVHRGIDNFFDGILPTWVDKVLWHGLAEKLIGMDDCPQEQKAAAVTDVTDRLQEAYNEVKAAETQGTPMSGEAIKQVVVGHGLPWIDDTPGEG